MNSAGPGPAFGLETDAAPAPDPLDGARVRVGKGSIAAYLFAYFGTFLILIVPLASTLALKVAEIDPENKATSLGMIAGAGALVAILANPINGALSDRTTSRFGMRRPWILGGAVIGVVGIIAIALASTPLMVGVGWAVVQVALNGTLAGLNAFLPDRVPEEQRGKVAGLTGIAQQCAPFLGIAVAQAALGAGGGTLGMFLAPSLIGLVLVMIYAITMEDRVLSIDQRQPFTWSVIPRAFALNPKRNPDFAWAWLGRFLVTLGFAASATYTVYFLTDHLDVAVDKVLSVQLLSSLAGVVLLSVTAAVAGGLSDRLGRRKVFVFIACGILAVGYVVLGTASSVPMYFVGAAVISVATGAYFAVDLALVTDVLPDKETHAARDMGVFNIASTLPQSLAPLLAPLLLAIGPGSNYPALWFAAGGVAIVGSLTLIPIKGVK